MTAIVAAIAEFFGISIVRLLVYSGIAAAVIAGGLTIRQHYINKGYASAIAAVKKQDNIAIDAAKKVETKTATCEEQGGYWDVLTKGCKMEAAQ